MFRLLIFTFILSFELLAEYPTVWTVLNETEKNLSIVCKSDAYGISTKLDFVMKIKGNEHRRYVWSGWHYNDGLGLSPAEWKCSIKSNELDTSYGFQSGWGENVSLILSMKDSKLIIKKN
ncbi:MAG: hypothetical protein SFU98_08225 [Leptospiraceae bacterium]|nr:hypothetical protein [Leptospiraceae bacterium]